ncbi:MAG: DEAD/DEAH box helicase [Gemmatimonadetes bacterium]|nr:DEAD/DEAH box helicase [Gemmatimonadota bacterium]
MEKMALSGTPWRGNPLNQWGTLHWLDLGATELRRHAERWFQIEENDDYRVIESVRPDVEHEFGIETDVTMMRRTKGEVAPWLPSKVYAGTRLDPKNDESPIGVWLDMGVKQAKAYEDMTLNAVARLESGELSAIGVLAEMTRQKQFACSYGDVTRVLRLIPDSSLKEWADTFAPGLPSNKWEWIVEFLDERGINKEPWGDGKVVIGSWQTGLLNIFKAQLDRLRIPSLIITGQTKNADRAVAKAKFQKPGGPRVFLLNTYAGGVSLTLDRADDMVVIDETWVPDDRRSS